MKKRVGFLFVAIFFIAWWVAPAIAHADDGMVLVKGGCFQMGDIFGDGESNEKPVHKVCLDDFYMGKYEVTQKQWTEIMGNNPSHFIGCDDCPVEDVSWDNTQEYITKLNQKTGKKYRLPTEAEWEYAARSGGKNEKWAGTTSASELGVYAWYDENSNSKTNPVGQKKPNGLGLYDMCGNVFEWVQDWYDRDYYKNSPVNNPAGPSSGRYRVLRGGSWVGDLWSLRAHARDWNWPANVDRHLHFMGFRLVLPSSGK